MPITQELITEINQLLSQAQLSNENLVVKRCDMGGNNRTYRIETKSGIFIVKKYFSHKSDIRDRLGAEFLFLSYAEKVAPEMVPKAYAQNSSSKIALYEFIDGQPLTGQPITIVEINQAIEFFCRLNEAASRPYANQLNNASEACFSIQNHFDLISARIEQMQQITPVSEESRLAQNYASKLKDFWLDWVNCTSEEAKREGFVLTSPLPLEQRCVSPSDFGFHNALRTSNQTIRFLDFEYAGWDDPAKMAGDFFSQIAVPVPEEFFELFIQLTMKVFPGSESLIRRANILRLAYQVKWCCIALNVFLPHHMARRKFANEGLDEGSLERSQIVKVKSIMKALKLLGD